LGGFVWVVGDLFQQYAAKYIGISRGIPLSNTNQLWGLAWGLLVFGELRGRSAATHGEVIGGSLLMALGAAAIALASATGAEHRRWQEAAEREGSRYGIDRAYVRAALAGETGATTPGRRSWLDWTLVGGATAVFIGFGAIARVPSLSVSWGWVGALVTALVALLVGTGLLLWRTTGFN
ncbi:MAG TPA: GRP family sugar transporter, partial [Gemmatimonadales bacterium]|nr:GRP family sugar transporter [Gemmatimonadales bacterium]